MRRITALVMALFLVFALAVPIGLSAPTAAAAPLMVPSFAETTFNCGFGSLGLMAFEDARAGTTRASWGVSTYFGYSGQFFASTWVKVTYLEQPRGNVVVAQPALPGEQEVTCYSVYSGATAKIVLLTPVPSPPSRLYASFDGPAAEPGSYREWVVLSPVSSGCFTASRRGEYGTHLNFCVGQQWPQVWDIFDIDYDPGQESRVTVRGTLIQTADAQPPVTAPPTTTASLSPGANPQGWHTAGVTVALTAQAASGGPGVEGITYSATGAQAIAATTVPGASASFRITTEGQTTVTFFAKSSGGPVETPKGGTVKLDTTPPAVVCGTADGAWHPANVSVGCTAKDDTSGLATPADASFSLATTVPDGTETASASTAGRQVCDVAGHCATAGPVSGNRIDRKAPGITITAPTTGAYLLNQAIAATYACTDGGAGVATCAGPVPIGTAITTASVGTKSFLVNANDAVGNASSQTVSYTVQYGICSLSDSARAYPGGAVIPLRLQLCNASGENVSASGISVHATGVTQAATSAPGVLADGGNANPDNDFRYDPTLGGTGGYIYNLSTKGLGTGTYTLHFQASGDPVPHTVQFQVK
jgi:hypothetical protein